MKSDFNDDLEVYWCDLGCEPVKPVETLRGPDTKDDPARWSNLGLILVVTLALSTVFLYEFEVVKAFWVSVAAG